MPLKIKVKELELFEIFTHNNWKNKFIYILLSNQIFKNDFDNLEIKIR